MNKKILLCDDEVHILRAAEIKIGRAGYDVRVARDGQEAWESILDDQPDVLVTDLDMPRCDGLELTRRIRENPGTKNLPIVMLTARGFEFDRHDMIRRWGIVDVLSKPFSPRELVGLIHKIFGDVPVSTR